MLLQLGFYPIDSYVIPSSIIRYTTMEWKETNPNFLFTKRFPPIFFSPNSKQHSHPLDLCSLDLALISMQIAHSARLCPILHYLPSRPPRRCAGYQAANKVVVSMDISMKPPDDHFTAGVVNIRRPTLSNRSSWTQGASGNFWESNGIEAAASRSMNTVLNAYQYSMVTIYNACEYE